MSTPQGSLEASSRQQLGLKSGSMESHGTIRKLISSGRALEEGSSGQQLAARLQSSSFASEQVGCSRPSGLPSRCHVACSKVSQAVSTVLLRWRSNPHFSRDASLQPYRRIWGLTMI